MAKVVRGEPLVARHQMTLDGGRHPSRPNGGRRAGLTAHSAGRGGASAHARRRRRRTHADAPGGFGCGRDLRGRGARRRSLRYLVRRSDCPRRSRRADGASRLPQKLGRREPRVRRRDQGVAHRPRAQASRLGPTRLRPRLLRLGGVSLAKHSALELCLGSTTTTTSTSSPVLAAQILLGIWPYRYRAVREHRTGYFRRLCADLRRIASLLLLG